MSLKQSHLFDKRKSCTWKYHVHICIYKQTSGFATPPGDAMVVLDSIPLAGDVDETLLPCSPTQMMNTNIVAATLTTLAEKEDAQQAGQHARRQMFAPSHIHKYFSGGPDRSLYNYIHVLCVYTHIVQMASTNPFRLGECMGAWSWELCVLKYYAKVAFHMLFYILRSYKPPFPSFRHVNWILNYIHMTPLQEI